MAIELGTAYISILPDTSKLSKGIKDSLRGSERDASASGSRMGSSMGKGFIGSFGKVVAVTGGIGAAIGLGSFIKEAGEAADATVKFKQTLDFAGLGTKQIEALTKATTDYANKTVYELGDVQNVTAQLAANGVKDFEKVTEAAGNLNAVAGGNAETFKSVGMVMTQTAGAGKLTTENWNQLADAIPGASGIIQKALLKNGAYTGNFRDAMAKGQITAEEFNEAILQVGSKPVAVKAAKSTKTFEGALGNLKATITGALIPAMTALQPVVSKVAGSIGDGVTKFAGFFGDKVMPKLHTFYDFVHNKIFPVIGDLGGKVKDAWSNIAPKAAGFAKAGASWVKDFIGNIKKGLQTGNWKSVGTFLGHAIIKALDGISNMRQDLTEKFVTWFHGVDWAGIGKSASDGIKNFIGGIDWNKVGKAIGNALSTALSTTAEIAGAIFDAIATMLENVDWIGLGLKVGAMLPSLLAGIAIALLNLDWIGPLAKGLADHWQVALFAVLGLVFMPAKWIGKLAELLSKIPFVGRLLGFLLKGSKSIIDKTIGPWIKGFVGGFFKGLWGAFREMLPGTSGVVGRVVGVIIEQFRLLPTRLGSYAIDAGKAIIKGFEWFGRLIGKVIGGIIDVITQPFRVALHGLEALFRVGWKAIGALVRSVWTKVIKPVFSAMGGFLKNSLGPAFKWLWSKIIKPVFGFIGNFIKAEWRGWKAIFNAIRDFVTNKLGATFTWLWKRLIKPVFDGVGKVVTGAWNKVIKPVFQALGNFIKDHVQPTFKRGVDGIKSIWNGLRSAAAKPINFLIDTVYNNGIRKLVNHIPGVPDLPEISKVKFASGGVMPGYTPGKDVHHFYSPTAGYLDLSGGEAIMRPEFTRAVGGEKGVAILNALARKGFATGGVFKPINRRVTNGLHDTSTGYPAIDFATPVGTPVYAVADGYITRSYDIRGYEPRRPGAQDGYRSYGRVMYLHTGMGPTVLYAHLSKRGLGAGTHVQGGQVIGLSGDTGNSTGPHLHFGSRGASPYYWLGGAAGHGSIANAATSSGLGMNPLKYISKVKDWMSTLKHMGGPFGPMLGDAAGSIVGSVKHWATGKLKAILNAVNPLHGTPDPYKGKGPVQEQVKSALRHSGYPGWASGPEWNALAQIISHESGWRVNAQNPTSSAYGLFQFLDSTRAAYGYGTNAYTQTIGGAKYIKARYGDPIVAWNYWQAHHSYKNGGVLGNLGIYDNGGVLKPGQFAYNASTKPEAVFNNQQFKAFAQGADRPRKAGRPRRLAMEITNWQEGRGFISEVAQDAIDDDYEYSNTVRRMG